MTNLAYRRLRAPQEDGAALVDPPLSESARLVSANRALAATWDRDSGLPFSKWRDLARRQLLFESSARPNPRAEETAEQRPLILSGHQPTLYHPGVWFKSFLLDRIAKHVGGAAVHLVIDNDTIGDAGIRVPMSAAGATRLVEVSLDAPDKRLPLEERRILDPAFFRSFAQRVREALQPLLACGGLMSRPLLVDRLWEHAEKIVRPEMAPPPVGQPDDRPQTWSRLLLGDCLAKALQRLERDLGLESRQQWLRTVCSGWPFAYFIEDLLSRWRELHPIYNSALAEYRVVNHIRSQRQPAPDLVCDGDWLEAPLWIWSAQEPMRRRAFVRSCGKGWMLTDRAGLMLRSSGADLTDEDALCWTTADHRADVKVRPRALITTMYARLVLSDLFIHGIGGAKYDELTDEIIRRFFGIQPPKYITATATFRLPIDRPQVTIEDVRHSSRRIRDVRFHPESLLSEPLVAPDAALKQELEALASEKRDYVRTHVLRGCSRDVYRGLDRINRAMRERLASVEAQLLAEHARLADQHKQSQLLGSREFSFVLFPEEYLVPRLLALSEVSA
jgi:hypothetical protein